MRNDNDGMPGDLSLDALGIEELRKLQEQPRRAFELAPFDGFLLVTNTQLATRVPGNDGPTAPRAMRAAKDLQRQIAPEGSALHALIDMGWNPDLDRPAAPWAERRRGMEQGQPPETPAPLQPGMLEADMVVMLYHDVGSHQVPRDLARLVQRLNEEQHDGNVYATWVVESLGTVLSDDVPLTADAWVVQENVPADVLFALPRLPEDEPFEDLYAAVGHALFVSEMLCSACAVDAAPTLIRELARAICADAIHISVTVDAQHAEESGSGDFKEGETSGLLRMGAATLQSAANSLAAMAMFAESCALPPALGVLAHHVVTVAAFLGRVFNLVPGEGEEE